MSAINDQPLLLPKIGKEGLEWTPDVLKENAGNVLLEGWAFATSEKIKDILQNKTLVFSSKVLSQCRQNIEEIKKRVWTHAKNSVWAPLRWLFGNLAGWLAARQFNPLLDTVAEKRRSLDKPFADECKKMDPTKFSKEQKKLFERAFLEDNVEAFNFIAGKDIDVYGQLVSKKIYLTNAVYLGSLEIMRSLLKAGANIDGLVNCKTPLECAINSGSQEKMVILQEVLKAGADVNLASWYDGQTPLHLAVSLKNLEIVKILVEHGADVSAKTNLGKTPLDLCGRGDPVQDQIRKLLSDAAFKKQSPSFHT